MADATVAIQSSDAEVSISEAARLTKSARTTILRRISNDELHKTPDGKLKVSELISVFGPLKGKPAVPRKSKRPPDYEQSDTPEQRRGALRDQVKSAIAAPWVERQAESLGEMNLRLTEQLLEKDKTIKELTESASDDRQLFVDQISRLASHLLPAPDQPPPVKRRWWQRKIK